MSSKKNVNNLNKVPKAVIFDTDNTLYPYTPAHKEATRAVENKVEKVLGIDKLVFRKAFSEARSEIKERLGSVASSHSRLLYMQRTIEKLELGTRILTTLDLEQTYWRTFLNHSKLFPGVIDFIHLLKSKEIITANITDNGTGFPKENIKNIIKPYFTTKHAGSGLGLSIVNKIINDHNGSVKFNSNNNEAKVEITLPKN